jgi:hypothetical protein
MSDFEALLEAGNPKPQVQVCLKQAEKSEAA